MREPVIKSYVDKVIAHATANGGICRWGFKKDLVAKAAQVAPLLKITCNHINNKVRNIKGQREQQEVTPAIPYHAIGCPTLSTNSDLTISSGLISDRASAENFIIGIASSLWSSVRVHQKQHYFPYYLSIVFYLSLKYAFGIMSMFFSLVRCSIILSRLFLTYLHPCFLPYVRIYQISVRLLMSHEKCPIWQVLFILKFGTSAFFLNCTVLSSSS
jgi:hypothetical protein